MGFWSFVYGFIPDVWFSGMNLRSYTGVILVNSIRARRRDRTLMKALNRLKRKYTPDKLAELYEQYSSAKKLSSRKEEKNRRKFERKLEKFINNFVNDYQIFRSYYLDALRLIFQSLLSGKRESKREFTDVEILFAELEKNKNQLIFPYKEIQLFKGQLRQLLLDLSNDIRSDELSDRRLEKGGYPVGVSYFSFFSPKRRWSRRKVYRKEKREVKVLGKELSFYEKLLDKINQELQSGVRQDFLFLLIEFFKRVDIADKRMENIKQDLELILKKLWDEVENVKKSLNSILTLLRNEPQIKENPELNKVGEDISRLEEVFQRIIKQDFKNTEALRVMLDIVLKEGNVVMAEIEEQAMKLQAA